MAKYPHITVQLIGTDGNIFALGGKVGGALRRAGVPAEEISAFYARLSATESYDAALRFLAETVEVQ